MAELKTRPTNESVTAFLEKVEDPQRRADCFTLLDIMRAATGREARMWGPSIIGFGEYTYKYPSGRSGTWMISGFSPRKAALTLYLSGSLETYTAVLARLGKHKTSVGCLYIRRLADVDQAALAELVQTSHCRKEAEAGSAGA